MKPAYHLHLAGECPICIRIKTYTYLQENFINAANKVHNNKYDYSAVCYIRSTLPVLITCPKHGYFLQTPALHLKATGCVLCQQEAKLNKFLTTATIIHKCKYDYSKVVNYTTNKQLITIICPIHGEFTQTPNAHLSGQGCKACGLISKVKSRTYTLNKFIAKAVAIHGVKYDYSKVVYKHNNKKVLIICPKHGVFKQTPHDHIQGRGCFRCKESHGERKIRQYLTKHAIPYKEQYYASGCSISDRKLFFDFAIFINGKLKLIEYNGRHHYEPVNYTNNDIKAQKNLRRRQKLDTVKKQFCVDSNIPLLELPYWDIKQLHVLLDKFIFT